jgi:hypothetical protein
MNIPWMSDGSLSLEPPISTPNCYIRLRADMDLLPINGLEGKPRLSLPGRCDVNGLREDRQASSKTS